MGRPELNFKAFQPGRIGTSRFIFVLLPGFSSLDLGAGLESLSAANITGDRPSFAWQIISETGEPVASSSGMTVAVDGALPSTHRGDCIVTCSPLTDVQPASPALKAWLRQATRFGAQLCGLGGGAALLAEAGLAEGSRLSAHWKSQSALMEQFPDLEISCSIFEESRTVVTSAGGAATLDLFSALISQKCGAEVASQVADQLLCGTVRSRDDRQTRSDLCRLGTRHEKFGRVIQSMQENLEHPVTPSVLAEEVGMSTRQLERLFQRYLGTTPKAYLTALRLERARQLLQQTHMRVIDVAIACGFSSASHFSKLYRRQFGTSPHGEQGSI